MATSLAIERKRVSRERDTVEALHHHFASVGLKLADRIEQNSNGDPLKHIAQEESSFCMVFKIFDRLCPENLWSKVHLRSQYSRHSNK